jgi:two-component system phosphate regulon sensor histidine kinase PhoR
MNLEPGSLRKVLENAVEVCRLKATERQVRLEIECAEDLQLPINAPLLEQAVINLIDNAVKFSPDGDAVRVAAGRDAGEAVISVRDRGCGISREHLSRIFERFYRVDKARSRKLGGTGLGLSIVKHIAQVHGGRAAVESTVGEGSTFTIHLPLREA